MFPYLVADAPCKYGGMVTVAKYKIGQVTFVPFQKILAVIIFRFGFAPHIKHFILYNKAHAVAQFQQFGCWWIVRRADTVASHLFEDFQLTLQRAVINGSTQTSQVVMQAHALYFHGFTIERKALLRIEGKCAYTGGCVIGIGKFAVHS